MKRSLIALSFGLSLALSATSGFAQAPAALAADVQAAVASTVSADAAQEALARGAFVVDIRDAGDYAAGHLPGAISAPGLGVAGDLTSLQALVSRHGIDLSREVLIVGRPGDERAFKLQARLAGYATGRVVWLVGGVHEWALSGRAIETQVAVLPPVPQYLVQLQPSAPAPRMAGANMRDLSEARPTLASAL